MRILLVGEYSRLHNSLKEGLTALGHEVILVGNGDGFKNFPVDFSIKPKWCETQLLSLLRKIINRIFKFDIVLWEQGIRFYFWLPKMKDFDVVQLINESPIQTTKRLELLLLKKVVRQNKKLFLLSSGVDYLNVRFLLDRKLPKSLLQPYFENPALEKKYQYVLNYISKGNQKIHHFVYQNCEGIIASDMDYAIPLKDDPKFLGLIPNPVNCAHLPYLELPTHERIVIFMGINEWNYHQKGISYFEKALAVIEEKYNRKVEIIRAKNIPYQNYISLYNKAHILLDQVFAYDQGYNALEAMAKGKVVFTGAEKEFVEQYKLTTTVAVNAKPDVAYLTEQLSYLIENPQEITAIGKRARAFIEREHDYIRVAQLYVNCWER